MKLTEKMKKNLAILGGVLIGIGLIAAIGMQFGSKPSGKDVLPGTGETETELIVDPGDFEKKEEESKVVSREEESLVIHQGIGEIRKQTLRRWTVGRHRLIRQRRVSDRNQPNQNRQARRS